MGKTTIDGLAVRESSNTKRKVSASRNQVVGAQKSAGRTPTPKKSPAVVKPLGGERNATEADLMPARRKAVSAESFLEPVRSFDYAELGSGREKAPSAERSSTDKAFTTKAEASWVDLLDELPTGETETALSQEEMSLATKADLAAETGLAEIDTAPDSADGTELVSVGEFARPETSGRWLDDWAGSLGDDEKQSLLNKFVDDTEEEDQKPKRHKRKFAAGKIMAVAMALVVLVGGGALYMWGDGLISRLTGGKSGLFDSLRALISDAIPFETDANGRTNVLIFGTEGYDMAGTSWNGVHDGAQLTDSIMVASFDQETKDVALLSLPRDLKVSMACSAGKINEVFWCHNQNGTDEEAGARALMKQIGDVLGIELQYYAHVNWGSLVDIIDTLGGVTVTLDEDINDYYYTGAVAKAGEPITVNGEQALGLARARHGTTGGDFTRGNTQQKIVEAIVQKVLQTDVGVNEALGLLNILGDNLRSNFSADNIKAAVRMASGFNVSNIRQVPLVDYAENVFYVTTATINEVSYVVPAAGERNYADIQAYVAGMFSSDGVKRERAKFAVYNATGGYGVAGAEKTKLEESGFNVVRVGDATTGACETAYCIYAMNDEKVETRAVIEERYGVSVRPASELPGGVLASGADFVIIVGAVSE